MIVTEISRSQCLGASFNATGTKQRCVLAPVLLSVLFSVMFHLTFRNSYASATFQFCTGGSLLNMKGQNFRPQKYYQGIDPAWLSVCWWWCIGFSHISENSRNTRKVCCSGSFIWTDFQHQENWRFILTNARGRTYSDLTVMINSKLLKWIRLLEYPGSTVNFKSPPDNEINVKVCKSTSAFGRLAHCLLDEHDC